MTESTKLFGVACGGFIDEGAAYVRRNISDEMFVTEMSSKCLFDVRKLTSHGAR